MEPDAPEPADGPPAADLSTAWNAMLEERREQQEGADAAASEAPPVEPVDPAPPAPLPAAVPRRRPFRFALTVGTVAALAGGNGYLGWQLQRSGETADRLAADLASLQGERARDATARGELTRERDELHEQLDGVRGELQGAAARAGSLQEQLEKASAESETLAAERTKLEQAIEQKTKEAQASAERADALREQAEQLQEQKKALEERQDELAKEKAKLFDQLGETKDALDKAQKKLAGLQKTLDAIAAAGHNLDRLSGKVGPPRVTAKVLVVLDDAQPRGAIVSAGQADRILKGDVFYVFRGETEVGRLEVRSVDASRAAAWIVHLQPGQDIRTGDEARTFR